MPPKISVVIPSLNKAKYISQTLESIADQGYGNLEVIVEDGGSTDGTVAIIKMFAQKYKYIKWESKKDDGQLSAINAGLKKATGDILTFINADDCYDKGAFKEVSEAYKKNPDSLWFAGRGIVINEDGIEIAKVITFYKNLLLYINHKSLLLMLNYLIQPSVFLTKKAVKKFGKFTGTKDFVMEYNLWLKIGCTQMPVSINNNLSKFRIEISTKTKTMAKDLLLEDRKVVSRHTQNKIILILHDFHNFMRLLITRFI